MARASSAEIVEAKEKPLRRFERALDTRLRDADRRREAADIADRAVRLLTHHLSANYAWDSFTEEWETRQALSQELRLLVERKYPAGRIDPDELKEYVEEWAHDRPAETVLD